MTAADQRRLGDALLVAIEHIAWCRRRGDRPYDIFAAIGRAAPLRATWADAIWAIAQAQDAMLPVRRAP